MDKDKGNLIIGVIGGMGPAASALFYSMVIDRTCASSDQEHVNMIILNHASMPDRTASIQAGDTDGLIKNLTEDIRMLEKNGADAIAIPCNTSHAFADQIMKDIDIPLINMVDETVKELKRKNVKKAAVLATDGTICTELYQNALRSQGIEPYVPDEDIQRIVMKIIYEDIKGGKGIDKNNFLKVDDSVRKNSCDAAIMACTELSVVKSRLDLDDFYTDAMLILAERSIEFAGRKLKNDGRL